MEITTERTILKQGNSLCVTIPFDWAVSHNLHVGDKVMIKTKDKTITITLIKKGDEK